MHRITTPDPGFNPTQPVEINGYLFVPSAPLRNFAAELRSGDHMWQSDRLALADKIDPPRPKGWPAPEPQPDKPVPPDDWGHAAMPERRYGKRYVAPPRPGFAAGYVCGTRLEGDEKVCPACGLRWSVKEERPPCPK